MPPPQTVDDAADELAETFKLITKLKPQVTIVGRDPAGPVVIAVGYRGNRLVEAMQIEAFVVGRGDTIRHRSQLRHGNTILVYNMTSTRKP